MQLAHELGVSQGTVRKALDDLAAENLVVRRQGRGTFDAEHDTDRALFHFFHLVGEEGSRQLPESRAIGRAVVSGKSVYVRVDLGGSGTIKKNKHEHTTVTVE